MPLYEYQCSGCRHIFEEMRPMSRATEDSTCPVCQARAGRIMSVCAAVSLDSGGAVTPVAGGSSCSSCGSAASCTSS